MFEENIVPKGSDVFVGSKGDSVAYTTSSSSLYTSSSSTLAKINLQRRVQEALDMNIDHHLIEACRYVNKIAPELLQGALGKDECVDMNTSKTHKVMTKPNSITSSSSSNIGEELEEIMEEHTLARHKEFLRSFANVHDAYQRVNAQVNKLEQNVSKLSHVLLSRQDDIRAFCNEMDIMEEEKRGVQYHNQVINALTEQYQFGQREEQLLCSESAEVNEQFLDVLERARALHAKSKELMLNAQTYNSEIGVMLESVYTVIVIAVDKIVHYLLSTAMVSNEPVQSTHFTYHLNNTINESKSGNEQTIQTLSLLSANGKGNDFRNMNFALHHKRTLGASLAADEPEVSSFYVHCIHVVHEENVEQWEHIMNEIVKLRQASVLRRYYHLLSTGSTTTQSGTYHGTHGNNNNNKISRKQSLLLQKGFASNKGDNSVKDEDDEEDELIDDERIGTRPLELEMNNPVYFFSALFAWLHQCIVQEADFYSNFCDDEMNVLQEYKQSDELKDNRELSNVLSRSNSSQMELLASQGNEKNSSNKIVNRTSVLNSTFDHITSHVDKVLTKIIQHLKRTSLIYTHASKQSPSVKSFTPKTVVAFSVTQPQLSMPGKHDNANKTAENYNDVSMNNTIGKENKNNELSSNKKLYKPLGPRGLTGSLSRFFRAATGRSATLEPTSNITNNDNEHNNTSTNTDNTNKEQTVALEKCGNANTHVHQRSNTTESKSTKLSSVSPSSLELSLPVAAELPINASVPSLSSSLSISLPSSSLPSSALITNTAASATAATVSDTLNAVTSPAFRNDVIESAIHTFHEAFAQTNTTNSFAHTNFTGHVGNANNYNTKVYNDRVHDIRTKINKINSASLSRLLHGLSTLFMLLELFKYYDRITFRPLLGHTSSLTKFLQCDAQTTVGNTLISFTEECEMHMFDSLIGLTFELPILSYDHTNTTTSSSCNNNLKKYDYNTTSKSKSSMFVLEYFVLKKETANQANDRNKYNNKKNNNNASMDSNNSSIAEMLSKSMSIDREPSNTRSRLSLSLSLRPSTRSELHLNTSNNGNSSSIITGAVRRPSSSLPSTLFANAKPDELLFVYENVVLQLPSEVKYILTEVKKIIRDAAHNAEIMKNIDEKNKKENVHAAQNACEEEQNNVERYVCRMITMVSRYGVLLKQHPFLHDKLDEVCIDTLSLNVLSSLKEVLESESMYISTLSACSENKAAITKELASHAKSINMIDHVNAIIHELQELLFDAIVNVLQKQYFTNTSMFINRKETSKAITSDNHDDNNESISSVLLSSEEAEHILQEFTRFYALIASDGHVPVPPLVTSLNNAKMKRTIEERLTTYFCSMYKELYDSLMTENATELLNDKLQHSLREITPSQVYVLADL